MSVLCTDVVKEITHRFLLLSEKVRGSRCYIEKTRVNLKGYVRTGFIHYFTVHTSGVRDSRSKGTMQGTPRFWIHVTGNGFFLNP